MAIARFKKAYGDSTATYILGHPQFHIAGYALRWNLKRNTLMFDVC